MKASCQVIQWMLHCEKDESKRGWIGEQAGIKRRGLMPGQCCTRIVGGRRERGDVWDSTTFVFIASNQMQA